MINIASYKRATVTTNTCQHSEAMIILLFSTMIFLKKMCLSIMSLCV